MARHLLVAETETLFAELLCGHLRTLLPDTDVRLVRTVQELKQTKAENFDLVLVDLILADGDVMSWLRLRAGSARPRGKVIVLTACEKEVPIHGIFQSGVAGIVHKTDSLDFLNMALRTVLAGGSVCSPLIHEIRTRLATDPNHFEKILSPREQTILKLFGDGRSAREIARTLNIRESTVLDHRKNLMQKLDLHNQTELVAYALGKGFSLSPRKHESNI